MADLHLYAGAEYCVKTDLVMELGFSCFNN